MSEQTFQIIAICLYFAGMLTIGWFAWRKTKDTLGEYMLAGRGLKPWVAALSAGASDMSGWLLMGLPGAIYMSGLIEAWIAIGLTIGAWLNWKLVAPRLRAYTEVAGNSITIPSFLEHRLRDRSRALRILCGLIILVFFTFYVSSGMVASGKFFESTFGMPYLAGMLLVTAITVAYTLFGGFLGATLTDVAQGLLMLAALLVVPVVAIMQTGGPAATLQQVTAVDPTLLSFTAGDSLVGMFASGAVLTVISAVAWGLGYFGQPHIIVRFMALRSPQEAKTARRIGISWMVLTAVGAISTAIIGVAYFAQNRDAEPEDSETVFLVLTQILFHPFIAGLVLAAVLAAIMSTLSSQLIVCSSALVEDLFKVGEQLTGRAWNISEKGYVLLGRLGVLVVAIAAALIALNPDGSVLDLVGFAWAGFGASFGPVILLSLFWRRLTNWGALAGLGAGALTAFIWGQSEALSGVIYEIVPGFAVCLITAIVVSLLTYRRNEDIEREYTETLHMVTPPPAGSQAVAPAAPPARA